MSHFSVLVVGRDVDAQLYPFWELDLPEEEKALDPRAVFKIEIPESRLKPSFLEWVSHKTDLISVLRGEKEVTDEIALRCGLNDLTAAAMVADGGIDFNKIDMDVSYIKKNLAKIVGDSSRIKSEEDELNKYKNSPKSWVEDYLLITFSEKHRGWGYYYNPNAKWDWYEIGGRWSGYLILKPGVKGDYIIYSSAEDEEGGRRRADVALKRDIDWEYMNYIYRKRAEEQWDAMSEGELETMKMLWGVSTKEEHIRNNGISTFAILWNGKWYERGRMRWWAIVTDAKDMDEWEKEFNSILSKIPDDEWITIVDCHI